MELSQDERDKLYKLIDKVQPCVAISSKENVEQFKKWTEDQIKIMEVPNDSTLPYNNKIYLIPVRPPNKPIKVVMEEE